MAGFSIRNPFFIIVCCLMVAIVGTVTLVRMPVDLFPPINIPVVVVATFYSGMPPLQIETNITNPFERFFTLASGVEHIESRSVPGVSLIKIYFQPGTNADADLSSISNLAMADLRRLPPGTLPPVVLKFDASSLPVCLITLKGEGLNETELHDLGQYNVRNQIANVPGASVPQPFGGRYRQIMVYVDPLKLQAHQLSPMDVVRQINESNLILPAGDVKIGPFDYNLYSNSQAPSPSFINSMPLKTVGQSSVLVGDIGKAVDAQAVQTNVVRVDGQPSVYLPILKQGGDTNTIAVVSGITEALKHLVDIPTRLKTRVVFDQSIFVRTAIDNLVREGGIGLMFTGLMILLFLGSIRATAAVFLSIPLSALAAFLAIGAGGGTVNTMVLGGLALAFSRLIDNSVIVLENIFRHLEMGEAPEVAAEKGGKEVALAVLAATIATSIVFFPVVFLYGVSRFLFVALATAVILSLFASYIVAMTVVPLFCAKLIKKHQADEELGEGSIEARFGKVSKLFDGYFEDMLSKYDRTLATTLLKPVAAVTGLAGVSLLCLAFYPLLGVSFFPRTDPGQFVVNLKAPTGSRIELTEAYVKKLEDIVHDVVPSNEVQIVVANIGVTPDFSSIYTSNSAPHTAFVQVSLKEGHKTGSYEYMRRVRLRVGQELPQLTTYFQSGGLVDAVLNLGLPAPLDVQVSGSNMKETYATATELAAKIRQVKGVSDVLIPQDIDYPALQLDVDREKASQLGLSQKEVVDNVITSLTSNAMIAPNYWIDPKNGIPYLLAVQYPESAVSTLNDLKQIPLRGPKSAQPTYLDSVVKVRPISSPTEVDHYQLFRVIDLYVAPKTEDLGTITPQIEKLLKQTKLPEGARVTLRGSVQGMRASFKSFGIGLILSVVLVYLVLVAQFASWKDPFIILLAVPPGLAGVLLFLLVTNTTLNVMSLMGVVMMVGIVVSNSILIVEFARHLHREGKPIKEAVSMASRLRLRPVLMTSLATLLGLIPMALGIEAGSEQYAPLARAIIGGLLVSVVVTVYLVPAAYLIVHRKEQRGGDSDMIRRRCWLPPLALVLAIPAAAQSPQASDVQAASQRTVGADQQASPEARAANPPAQGASAAGSALTRRQAEAIALKNNPQITVGKLRALEAGQFVREQRSALLPNAYLSLTGVDASNGARIAAGGLNNPVIFPRAAAGATVSQLITDFGRTANLVSSAKASAKAEEENSAATTAQIVLAVDQAFYNALETRALLQVAQQTVQARRLIADRISALAQSKLKSDLDLSFASVDLSRAKLLQLEAKNNYAASLATLSAILGYPNQQDFDLQESNSAPEQPEENVDPLILRALRQRPEVLALQDQVNAAEKFAHAEHDLWRPTANALGAVGAAPVRDNHLPNWYGAVGVNINIPVFNGLLYNARAKSADLQTEVARQKLLDERNNVARDVRTAWQQSQQAFERLSVTQQLREQATLGLKLAQSRYDLGLGSIVELGQAELGKTEADIADTDAQYQYRLTRLALAYTIGEPK